MGKAKFRLEDPEKAPMTLEVTLTLAEWKKLRSQIQDSKERRNAPLSWLDSWIYDLTKEAEAHFEAEAADG